jgi:hypothetical protein
VCGLGGLPIDRAIHLWQAYVEPKFAYACGVWMHETNARAHSVVNRVQNEGARQLLGMSPYDEPAASRRRVLRCLKPSSSRRMSCA